MAEIGAAFISLMVSARDVPGQIDKQVTPGLTKVGKRSGLSFGKLFAAGAALGIGAKAFDFLGDSLGEAREAQKVSAQTTNVLKTMGLQSKVTADQIGAYATKLSNATGVDDELIQSSQNTLLTFGNLAKSAGVTGGAFQRASGLALDMSVALGTDLKGATVQIGKALNDPIKGITALSRSGVSFTEQQKKTIKSLVEGGKVGKAQGLILRELGKEFQGSAAAQATAGDKAAVSFGNLKEQIGTALLPVVDRFATIASTKVIPAISGFVTGIQTGTGIGGQFATVVKTIGANFGTIAPVLGTVVAGLAAYRVASAAAAAISVIQAAGTTAATGATFSLNAALRANPIGLVVTGLTLLVAGFVAAYTKSDTFRAVVDKTFSAIKKTVSSVINFVVPFVKNHWQLLLAIIGGPLGIIVGLVIKNFGTIKSTVSAAVNFVVSSAKKFGQFASAVGKHVSDAVQFFKDLPGKIKGFISGLPDELKTIGGNIIDGLKRGITDAGQRVLDAVQSIIDRIPKFIRKRLGIASPSKVTTILGQYIGEGLAKGLTNSSKKVTKAMAGVLDKAKEKLTQRIADFQSLASGVGDNLTGSLFSGFETAGSFLANLTTVKGNLGAAISDFKTLQGFGLSGGFLAKLFSEGGFPLIHELASNGDKAAAAGSLFKDIQSLSGPLGSAVAIGAPDIGGGATLADLNATLKEANKLLSKIPEKTGAHVGGAVNGAAAKGKRNGNKGKSRR